MEKLIVCPFEVTPIEPIPEVLMLHDIKLFLRTRLADITKQWIHWNSPGDWPLSSDIDVLCGKATGLFIYASTLVKFVVSLHHEPSERLSPSILLPQDAACEGKSGIDPLYTEILRQAFHDCGSRGEREVLHARCGRGLYRLLELPLYQGNRGTQQLELR